jgi:hypothetical protein
VLLINQIELLFAKVTLNGAIFHIRQANARNCQTSSGRLAIAERRSG